MDEIDLTLANRDGLPEPLRVLYRDYPREAWELHPEFGGLVRFWLERHMMFRKLMEMLQEDTQSVLDRRMDPAAYAPRLARFGGMLVNQLHGHHQIEDVHYFPVLAGLDRRIATGFDILDKDHQALDGIIERFTVAANGVLQAAGSDAAAREKSAGFLTELRSFERMLNRHLNDEEELVVPVILSHPEAGLG